MGLEQASTISELQAGNPLGGDPTNQGDDHLRLIKNVLKLQFPGELGNGFDEAIVASESDLNATSGATGNFQTQINDLNTAIGGIAATVVELIYPVGSLYTSTLNQNPAAILGVGTWSPYAAGRVLVGVDAGDPDLNTGGATGGSKDAVLPTHGHTGSTATAGQHTHTITNGATLNSNVSNGGVAGTVSKVGAINTTNGAGDHTHAVTVGDAGEDPTGKNMQPYITVYTWIRNA